MKLDDLPLQALRGTGEQVQAIQFPYLRSPDQDAAQPARHPVVIVGAGPVGLSAAIDLAQRGQPVLVLDNDDKLSIGSRALCFAKRTLEIWDRLGVGEPMVAKGVSWNVGKVFFQDQPVYQFNLLPEDGHERPAFINLQQYYCEAYLVERALQLPNLEIRWKNTVSGIEPRDDGALLSVDTPGGRYQIDAGWVIACDGSRSPMRGLMGLESKGRIFHDRFLIADVKMKADFPTERWFWFDPPFHPNQSVLLHRECDNVWRIDFQLGWDADPAEEKKPENVIPRIQAMLGPDVEFELEWVSVYQFACRRVDNFRHGRVLFTGDAAHQVSPFGARGANTGVQDCDNLSWKLALILKGDAPLALLDSYHEERAFAADDNLLNSTRSTDFITPKSRASLRLRNAVLELARTEPFARPLVNSGRLSTPTPYVQSSLNTPDTATFQGLMAPGTNCADAPVLKDGQPAWLLNQLGQGFTLLSFGPGAECVSVSNVTAQVLEVGKDVVDAQGILAQRYDAQPGTVYLIRPDQHVAARWRAFDAAAAQTALKRALALH